jgi:hypothetical protein
VTSDQKPTSLADALRQGAFIGAGAASLGVTFWLISRSLDSVSGNRMAPWILGRASGITAYLLLFTVVMSGLVLSHPWRARWSRPSAATRIRTHIALSLFTLGFTLLHVFVLATDKYAGVGWRGAFLPMAATYRPAWTTLGLFGLWTGLLIGLSAAAAGHVPRRLWWPIHKVAATCFVLVWLHGVLGGSDTHTIMALYVVTGLAVVGLGISRYWARTPADRIAELTS